MADLYETLGVKRDATDAELKKAYRKLAMENHPDRGGDQNRFAEISNAYETLKDPQKRAAYNRFGTADSQQQQANQGPFGFSFNQNQGPFDFDSIFEMFGQRMGPQGRRAQMDARISIIIDLDLAMRGGKQAFGIGTPQGHHPVELNVPKGVVDNENIRYNGLAPGGRDLVVNFRIRPHSIWQRDGLDLHKTQDLDFWSLILGTTVKVTDPINRTYDLTVPPRTKPGSTLRLGGRGLEREGHNTGDLFVHIHAVMPASIPDEITNVISKYHSNK